MKPKEAIERLKSLDVKCAQSLDRYEEADLGAIELAIKALEQEPKWIPVSEELPKVGENVLCKCQANIFEVFALTPDGWYHDEKHCYMMGFVVAWIPLPEPYKAESEE